MSTDLSPYDAMRRLVLLGAMCAGAVLSGLRAAVPLLSQVPALFAGEIEDVGPQYLLLAAPRPQPMEVWSELEVSRTSNATLVETNPTASTLTTAQAGGTWHFAPWNRWGGQVALETGLRMQTYRYGLFADPKRVVNFLEIDRNNFDLVGAHVGASWRRAGWFALVSLRGASLRNRSNARVFYQEGAMEWQIYRQWNLGRRTLTVGAEGAQRWSHTDSFGLLPVGWNNRFEQGLVALADQPFGRWTVQAAFRVLGTHYLYRDRSRDDCHASGRLSIGRKISGVELRLGLGYDRRSSSEAAIADFSKWDLGLAGRMQWRF